VSQPDFSELAMTENQFIARVIIIDFSPLQSSIPWIDSF
jgi:hypothetical protein